MPPPAILALLRSSAIRYAAVGAVNTIIGYSVIYASMYFASLPTVPANALGYGVGFFCSFFLNRRVTFRSSARTATALPKFAAVNAAAYVANLATVVLLERVAGVDPYLAQAFGLLPYLAIGYLGSRYLVFPTQTSPADTRGKTT